MCQHIGAMRAIWWDDSYGAIIFMDVLTIDGFILNLYMVGWWFFVSSRSIA